jgi:two-component system, NarL family, response regulator DesR
MAVRAETNNGGGLSGTGPGMTADVTPGTDLGASGTEYQITNLVRVQIVTNEASWLFFDVVAKALATARDFDVIGMSCDVAAARDLHWSHPVVTVVGTPIAGNDGLDLVSRLTESVPSCRIVLIANQPTRVLVDRAVLGGVLSVVPAHARLSHLVDVIRGVSTGCLVLDPALVAQPDAAIPSLTDREREILRLSAMGMPVRDIASHLFLAPGTVRNLTSSLIRRLGGRNRSDAARIAAERGWV